MACLRRCRVGILVSVRSEMGCVSDGNADADIGQAVNAGYPSYSSATFPNANP